MTKKQKWFIYPMSPIDFNWHLLDTVEETITKLSKPDDPFDHCFRFNELKGFLDSWEEAKDLAKQNHWEGDFRGSPHVFWLPAENEFVYGFAWKQDNNGSTFIVSPFPLTHLLAHTF